MSHTLRIWRFAGCFALTVVLAVGAPATAQISPEYTAALRDGRAAYKADDFGAAEIHFKAVLRAAQSPRQRASALGLLAMTAEQQKRADEARRHAEEALKEYPGEARAKDVLSRLGATPANRQATTPRPNSAVAPIASNATRPRAEVVTKEPTGNKWRWVSGSFVGERRLGKTAGGGYKFERGKFAQTCRVNLTDDLLRELPPEFPKSFAAYQMGIYARYCGDGLVDDYKINTPYYLTFAQVPPLVNGFRSEKPVLTVMIQADVTRGRLGDTVVVRYRKGQIVDYSGTVLATYKLIDGRIVPLAQARAAESGQTFVKFLDAAGNLDVMALRRKGEVLGVRLGAPWAAAKSGSRFVQNAVVYDKPCREPMQKVRGLLGGHQAEVTTVDGKVAQVTVFVSIHDRELYPVQIMTKRFGKPSATGGLGTSDYGYYGDLDADVKRHDAAPVTIYHNSHSANGTFEVRFNEVVLAKRFNAAVLGCRDRVGGAILGAAIVAGAKAVAAGAKAGGGTSSAVSSSGGGETDSAKRAKAVAKGRFTTKPDGKVVELQFNGRRMGRTHEDKLFQSAALGGGWKISCTHGRVKGALDKSFASKPADAVLLMQQVCKLP